MVSKRTKIAKIIAQGMCRAMYPEYITKKLITVVPLVPEGCMEVWEGRVRIRKGRIVK